MQSLAVPSALPPEQLAQLAAARQMAGKVRRVTVFAKVDGWTIVIFAALTLLLSIGSIPGMLLGAAMLSLGILQLRSTRELQLFREEATERLAMHQVLLGILIGFYGLYMAWSAQRDPNLLASMGQLDADVAALLADFEPLVKTAYVSFYVLVALVGGIGCGLTALYYRTRRKYIVAYREQTPQWILDLHAAGFKL